jgi:hypothetical protein
LTVTCVITRIDPPTTPLAENLKYTVNAPSSLVINLTPNFQQYPPCNFPVSETRTWTIPSGAPIVPTSGNDYQLTVTSKNMADIKSYSVSLQNAVRY